MHVSTRQKAIPLFQAQVSEVAIGRVVETLRSGWLGSGPRVREFESSVRAIIRNDRFLALNSGTAALELTAALLHLEPGDEVLTTPMTCLATNIPFVARGATLVWCDIKPNGTLDPASVRRQLGARTKAIVCVHFGGMPADLGELRAIALEAGVPLIEDAAHAFGARYAGQPIGADADFACFSFQAVKTLTTGDGGGLAVRHEEHFSGARRRRWFGIDREHRVPGDRDVREPGGKYEMNDIAASIGLGNLPGLDDGIRARSTLAQQYRERLRGIDGVVLPPAEENCTPTYWLFPVMVRERTAFAQMLRARGVHSEPVHYRNDAVALFQGATRSDALPVTDRWEREMTCLPIGPWVEPDDVAYITDAIRAGW